MPITRRHLLTSSAAGLLMPMVSACASAPRAPAATLPDGGRRVFLHGVASGDPQTDSVVLWTRATPPADRVAADPDGAPVQVDWSLYADPGLIRRVARGSVTTDARRDWTVKVIPGGLTAGSSYYYVFEADGERSVIGRTRTLPAAGASHLRIAYVSCSNLPFGFFNVYGQIARRNDLDLVLHLGDYIYEYRNGDYGDGTAIGRVPRPDREIVSLSDYRTRYAQYREDPDLQEVHRQHPMIAIWDDHETADNSWRDGAFNHDPEKGEGAWSDRKAAGVRAWHEWLPARDALPSTEPRIWRSFQLGGLADLMMLDTRLYDRSKQADKATDRAVIDDPSRTLLGPAQEAWLARELSESKARGTPWRILGQQVMFGQLGGYDGTPILNPDQWDGYPAARKRVLDHLRDGDIDNVTVLTGDIHSSWAMDIAPDPFDPAAYDPATGRGSLAVELVTPSVTSPFMTDQAKAETRAAEALKHHPHMRFVDLFHKGYVLLDLTAERLQAEFWHADTIAERAPGESLAAVYVTESGANHLVAASGASAPGEMREPAPLEGA